MLLVALACGLLTVALFGYVFSARPQREGLSRREAQRQAWEERKRAVYENLKDLHFEHLAGKLTDADFQRTRGMLEQEAAALTAKLGMQP